MEGLLMAAKRKSKKKKSTKKKKTTKRKTTKRKTTKRKAAKKKKSTKKKATKRKAAKKKPAKKKAKKKATKKKKTKRKPNAAFLRELTPSDKLAAVVGAKPLPRTQVVKKLWAYIKKHDLQNPKNRRNILADAKLKPIFGKAEVSMFEMTKIVSKHLK